MGELQRKSNEGLWLKRGQLFDASIPVDVLVSQGRIARIEDCVSSRAGVELDGAWIYPGLVNSHDHLDFTPFAFVEDTTYASSIEWAADIPRLYASQIERVNAVPRSIRWALGEAKNLLSGVTTVVHHGDHHRKQSPLGLELVSAPQSIHSISFEASWRRRLSYPWRNRKAVVHIGEGVTDACREEIDRFRRWNLSRRDLVAVHGIVMTPEQAVDWSALVWCPVSNMNLYGQSANVRALSRATKILFGTDSTLTGDWDIWNHLRTARALGALDDRVLMSTVTDGAASYWGAGRRALGLGDPANLIVVPRHEEDPVEQFFAIRPERLLLVMSGGRLVSRDPSLVLSGPIVEAGRSVEVRCSTVEVRGQPKLVSSALASAACGARGWGVARALPFRVPAR